MVAAAGMEDAGGRPSAADEEAMLARDGDRVAQLIEDLGTIGGAPVRQRVDELVGRLVNLYGAGLARLLRILGGDALDAATRARLLADPLVSSLLVLHQLHPAAEEARAAYEPAPPPARTGGELVQIDLARTPRAGGEGIP